MRKIEWVSVKEDMPFDNPNEPSISVPVRVKLDNNQSNYPIGYYCSVTHKWYNYKTNNAFRTLVVAWASLDD